MLLLGDTSPPRAGPATEAVAAARPNATVRPLAGQGQAANMTAPELLASEILSFLSSALDGRPCTVGVHLLGYVL
jgi:hypothetical protein